jgi:uncharacterized Zn finger protein (UPF0148 family)
VTDAALFARWLPTCPECGLPYFDEDGVTHLEPVCPACADLLALSRTVAEARGAAIEATR